MTHTDKVSEYYSLSIGTTNAKIFNHITGQCVETLYANCYYSHEEMSQTAFRKWRDYEGIDLINESTHQEFFVDGKRIIVER